MHWISVRFYEMGVMDEEITNYLLIIQSETSFTENELIPKLLLRKAAKKGTFLIAGPIKIQEVIII